jgi:5'-nucleotidase
LASSKKIVERVLLTNDDGIEARGLEILAEVATELAQEVWIVAPEHDQSGTSHSISLHEPLRAIQQDERRFAISGTPADCVVMAVRHLMGSTPPDLVLSGINRGANLGVETVFSGTVGGAMTGMMLGIPSIALSQVFTGPHPVKWETAQALAGTAIRQLVDQRWDPDVCLNVNFPDVLPNAAGPLTPTRQGAGLVDSVNVVAHTDPRGLPYYWLQFSRRGQDGIAGSETEAVQQGKISVTPLRFERTSESALDRLLDSLGATLGERLDRR